MSGRAASNEKDLHMFQCVNDAVCRKRAWCLNIALDYESATMLESNQNDL